MTLPAEPRLRWMIRTSSALLGLGAEPVKGLVTPTSDCFPDEFDGSPDSVATLLSRVQELAGLRSVPLELVLLTPEGEAVSGGCSSGACSTGGPAPARSGRLARAEDGTYQVSLQVQETRHPVALTTTLVRAVSGVFLAELDAMSLFAPAEFEGVVDLTGVWLGFGPLLVNGSHLVMKGCGGTSIHRATSLELEELLVSLAVFAELQGLEARGISPHLDPVPRAAYAEAEAWARANRRVLGQLRSDPEAIARDMFAFSAPRGWLSRLFGKSAASDDLGLDAIEGVSARDRSAAPRDPAVEAKRAALRALVDEALGGR
jgi:hypothetical protein